MGNSAKAVHSREQTRENEDMVNKVASTFEEADVIRMFPSFVWKTQLKEEIIKTRTAAASQTRLRVEPELAIRSRLTSIRVLWAADIIDTRSSKKGS